MALSKVTVWVTLSTIEQCSTKVGAMTLERATELWADKMDVELLSENVTLHFRHVTFFMYKSFSMLYIITI